MIEFTANGLTGAVDTLQTWVDRLNKAETLKPVDEIVLQSITYNYDSAIDYRRWPKRKGTVSWPILVKTGTKRAAELNSVIKQWRRVPSGWEKLIYSTDYGVYHQQGRGQKIRKSVHLQERVKTDIRQTLLEIFKR